MTVTDTTDALLAALDDPDTADPWLALRVLADRCDEVGDNRADGFRILAELARYPLVNSNDVGPKAWEWYDWADDGKWKEAAIGLHRHDLSEMPTVWCRAMVYLTENKNDSTVTGCYVYVSGMLSVSAAFDLAARGWSILPDDAKRWVLTAWKAAPASERYNRDLPEFKDTCF